MTSKKNVVSTLKDAVLHTTAGALSLTKGNFLSELKTFTEQTWHEGMLNGLYGSYLRLSEEGKAREDYIKTLQAQACLRIAFKTIDVEPVDLAKYKAIKGVFLNASQENKSDRESVLPVQYMRLICEMGTDEILVLAAAYYFAKKGEDKNKEKLGTREWNKKVASISGLKHPQLVEIAHEKLVRKKFFIGYLHSDKSAVRLGNVFGLSELGYDLCVFMEDETDPILQNS